MGKWQKICAIVMLLVGAMIAEVYIDRPGLRMIGSAVVVCGAFYLLWLKKNQAHLPK